jgi:hypothetical protein
MFQTSLSVDAPWICGQQQEDAISVYGKGDNTNNIDGGVKRERLGLDYFQFNRKNSIKSMARSPSTNGKTPSISRQSTTKEHKYRNVYTMNDEVVNSVNVS